ncbi:hypothetical protein [Candidatus Leptofilum sp.]|uniref:hypothetical protein n=1 Tax=Candidatus Leptofilum sp. TaxID=3241576 RepID=UPI003B5BB1A5
MFDKLFDKFDDIDMKKLVEVVNLVWNNREKFIDLVENLPTLLDNTGSSIESAGTSAVKASAFLSGDKKGSPSAGEVSKIAATALDRCQDELAEAAKIMASLGKQLDAVRIPSVKPKYIEVLGSRVVSGLEFGEEGILDNAADKLTDGSSRLKQIGVDLRLVSKNLRELGGALTETGKDLNNVGLQLKESGGTLRSLSKFNK